MSRLATKAELLAEIKTERRRLENNLAGLSVEEMCRPGMAGEWSVKDVLAHLAAWEQMFLGWYRAGLRGETPETPAPGLTWSQLDTVNRQIFERYRDTSLEEISRLFDESYRETLALVESLPEEALLTPGKYAWLNGARLLDWIVPNTSGHYLWAKNLVRKSKKTT